MMEVVPSLVMLLMRVVHGSGCLMLFAGGSRAQSVPEELHSVQGEPVLTVADRAPAGSGAIIQFVVADNRVRFNIDTAAASANRIGISSKLLSLAVVARSGA
jgi:hypothetical protein